jgi:glycosyltransferase involved in cell wall biosynthesis
MADNRPEDPSLRVLAAAFACDPAGDSGLGTGEDILGWNILRQIARHHDVWLLTSSRNRNLIGGLKAELSGHQVRVFFVDLPRLFDRWVSRSRGGIQVYAYFWQIRALSAALALHRRFRFEAFHHVTYANDWMASYIGAFLPVPFLRGPGGGTHPVPRAFLGRRSIAGNAWDSLRILGRWVFRADPVYRRGQERAAALLLCNEDARRAVPAAWRKKATLFPVNGLTDREFQLLRPATDPVEGPVFRVLSAGRLLPLKGFGLGILAFARFAEAHPASEFKIFGEGPDRPRLHGLLRSLRLEGQIRLLPWLPRERMLREITECDVFLFPSLYDGGGAVVVEAMAAGKSVVCLDSGGPGFHVDEAWGIKIAPRDPEFAIARMAESLDRLYRDRALRIRLGDRARKRVEEYYLWDKLGERLQGIYRRTLGARG